MIVKKFDGNLQIHIRQYKRYASERLYPAKIGITLTPTRFTILLSSIDAIKSSVEKLRNKEIVNCKLHLGGGTFVRINSDFPTTIDIRRFFLPEGEMTPWPTKKGIALRLHEWDSLVARLGDISTLINTDEKPCFERLDHIDPTVRFHCKECNPFQPFFLQNY